jgi:hypothetical protein
MVLARAMADGSFEGKQHSAPTAHPRWDLLVLGLKVLFFFKPLFVVRSVG